MQIGIDNKFIVSIFWTILSREVGWVHVVPHKFKEPFMTEATMKKFVYIDRVIERKFEPMWPNKPHPLPHPQIILVTFYHSNGDVPSTLSMIMTELTIFIF